MFFRHPGLLQLIDDPRKEIITFRACNLPKDSMFFSRAFVSYKNCMVMKKNETDTNDSDSCNSILVERTDSTQLFFRIYH
jgi:hypothetical protein